MPPRLTPGKGGAAAPPDPWDPLIRAIHWTIAVGVIANQFLNKSGGTWHVLIGWTVLGLLAIRFAWGLFGPAEARFSSFPPDPRAAIGHLAELIWGRPREYPSHNPAGALMAYALWACLAVVTATGLVMTGGKSPLMIANENAAVAAGDWSVLVTDGAEGDDGENDKEGLGAIVEDVHKAAANLMIFLVLIHVAGVVIESRALGRNLLRTMITGWRRNR